MSAQFIPRYASSKAQFVAAFGDIEVIIPGAAHAHTADNLSITQNHNIDVAGGYHDHLADNLALLQNHTIAVADSHHDHLADNITLYLHGLGLGIISDTTVISLTPQRGKLVLTVERSAKHV